MQINLVLHVTNVKRVSVDQQDEVMSGRAVSESLTRIPWSCDGVGGTGAGTRRDRARSEAGLKKINKTMTVTFHHCLKICS